MGKTRINHPFGNGNHTTHKNGELGDGANDIVLPIATFTNSSIWVNYNELTTSSLEIIVSKGKYPQMALIQVSELL